MKKITQYAILPILVMVALFFVAAKSSQRADAPSRTATHQILMDHANSEAELVTSSSGEPVATSQQGSVADPIPTGTETVTAPAAHKLTLKEKVAAKIIAHKIKRDLKKNEAGKTTGGKSQLVALLLVIFVGGLGIHRFYLGYTGIGIIQLLTAGGCGIWFLIDLIRIITGDLQPKDGPYEETL